MSNEQPKWTEIEHLPEWDEDFYEVYTLSLIHISEPTRL